MQVSGKGFLGLKPSTQAVAGAVFLSAPAFFLAVDALLVQGLEPGPWFFVGAGMFLLGLGLSSHAAERFEALERALTGGGEK